MIFSHGLAYGNKKRIFVYPVTWQIFCIPLWTSVFIKMVLTKEAGEVALCTGKIS